MHILFLQNAVPKKECKWQSISTHSKQYIRYGKFRRKDLKHNCKVIIDMVC